jgi:cephalosporin hydroxylase
MLATYCDNRFTDKNTTHSYIELYETLFHTKVNSATHVLEIGIGPNQTFGGSIMMWADYFKNAQIHAMDVVPIDCVRTELTNHPRIHLHTGTNAYEQRVVDSNFISKDIQFDIMIDDGPHTLESMVDFIKLYSKLLKRDGILVIEDVQDISWIDTLKKVTPLELNPFIEVYDRRHVKGLYDDIVFVINKSADVKC